ncbi:hypothetical protein EXIGLDRAFT_837457 [Exidia glandulosa HHB12029]|uniref:F-box domain-containing protein n=1 Tax=Exidia glandulosa HHB12029 TaxID=1314781 RepID=A0A165GTB8_EXIGL|nr:hypothetical protein EXIGLDRAFT_837457 [Exidia glandulosa HHB12029]
MLVELPVELVRQIIELAARDAHVDDLAWLATSLALVCRAVHGWILPILYHTVLLNGAEETMIALESFEPAPFMAHVKCLMLVDTTNFKHGRQLHPEALASFSNVQTFAVDLISLRRLAQVKDFCPTRLIYWPDPRATDVPTAVESEQVFRQLTHIRCRVRPWYTIARARFAPSITHVFLDLTVNSYLGFLSEVGSIRLSLLTCPRCERVTVRLYPPPQDSMIDQTLLRDIISALRSLRDPRIYLFDDPTEPLTSMALSADAKGMFKACAREIRSGADVWESGFQLCAGAEE